MADDYRAVEVKVLPELDRADEAKKILEKVCWQVQPIMRKRRWSVRLVTEFLPRGAGLLGMNHNSGAKIQVRMRQTKDSDLFPFENVLGTMLHELVHNEVGPHNANFYALLDEIQKECDDLMDKGLGGSGAGFDLAGKKLSNEAHNPTSTTEGRLKALKAAEGRLKKQELMGCAGGRRLGGKPPPANRTPAQMAAEAALRRLHDDTWCHTGRDAQEEEPDSEPPISSAPHAAQSDGKLVPIDPLLNSGVSSFNSNSGKPRVPNTSSDKQPTPARSISRSSDAASANTALSAPSKKAKVQSAGIDWHCSICTLRNDAAQLVCGACNSPRSQTAMQPTARTASRFCRTWCGCGSCSKASGSHVQQGPCPTCTYINAAADVSCKMCGTALPPAKFVKLTDHAEAVVVLD